MLMVSAEAAWVEAELVDGRLGCPSCRAVLGPWGHARPRVLRCSIGDRWLRPRRARCRGCAGTHVLLPDVALLRRQDEVTVIGAAIRAHVGGEGHRRIAARLGVPAGTVRGWLRRVLPAGSGVADALEAIAVAARAWVLRFGPGDLWRIVSVLSGGALLGNTSCPFPAVR
ncbi:MAG: DUF6431 domain-containing protein [Actinobacteria bacterium]|nr:DUF6431 domain-containing protein [Actinomycetota bacterium]